MHVVYTPYWQNDTVLRGDQSWYHKAWVQSKQITDRQLLNFCLCKSDLFVLPVSECLKGKGLHEESISQADDGLSKQLNRLKLWGLVVAL